MANSFNPLQDVQYSASQLGQQRLSVRDKLLIETLLVDSGVIDFAVAAPTPTPGPAPTPSPSPTPAPAPAAAASPTPSPTLNLFVQLALNKIRPGDLITAQFANDLVDAALSLDARLRVLEGYNRVTSTPTPTPGTSPTPSSSANLSATDLVRADDAPKPTIDKITATTVRGKGVTVAVAGDNIGEGQIERVLLGATQIAPSSIKFVRGGGGFTFTTTTAIVEKSKNRLTVVTAGGQDSAALSAAGGKVPVL